MSTLRVALIQTPLYWEDPALNRQMLTWKIRDLAGETDLIVLPEMFTSGFTMNPGPVAEAPDGPTTEWLLACSRETGAAITGSLVISQDGHYWNRLLWAQPDGTLQHYDKRHRFGLAGEDRHYAAGTSRLLVHWKGWTICPLICYDLRFPVWSRNRGEYDLLLYVANWPEPRRQHWRQLLLARAIENQACVLGVNRVGQDDNGHTYAGDSTIIRYDGETLQQAAWTEAVLQATLDRHALLQYRERLPFLADSDAFQWI